LGEFEFVDENEASAIEVVPGKIATYIDTRIRKTGMMTRKWKVEFRDGDILSYELEELVDMIRFAALSGLDVTPNNPSHA